MVATLLACMVVNTGPAARAAEEPILNVYNWADYIDPSILEDFEAEYGIRVNYDIYDSSEIVDTKLMTGGSGYDVVVHSAAFSVRLIPIGVYQAVDYERLENWHHVDPDILRTIQEHYPSEMVGIPYMWGTTGFSYNVRMLEERMPDAPLDSASLVFDPEIISRFADCGVSLLDDPTTVIPFAMLYLGHSPNSVEPEHLADAEALLKSIRPYIKYFSSTKMLIDLPSEEVCIAMSWSGDYAIAAARARESGLEVELGYSVPIEGSIDWFDMAFIPADAPHPDNAHLFLDYLLRPDIIARATNYIGYANANRSATPLVDPDISGDPAIYPDAAIMQRLYPSEVREPKLERRRSRTWTRVKSGL